MRKFNWGCQEKGWTWEVFSRRLFSVQSSDVQMHALSTYCALLAQNALLFITRAQTVDYPTYLRHVAARSEAYAFSCLNCYNCCIDSIATTTAVYRPSSCRTSDRDALLLFSTPPSEPPWRQTTNQAHSHYSYTHKPPFPQLIQGQVLEIQIIHTAPQISTKYTSSPCSNYTWTLPSLY